VYRSGKVDDDTFASLCTQLGQRLDTLSSIAPIAFRAQNAGDYDIPALTLREDLVPGLAGFAAHQVS